MLFVPAFNTSEIESILGSTSTSIIQVLRLDRRWPIQILLLWC